MHMGAMCTFQGPHDTLYHGVIRCGPKWVWLTQPRGSLLCRDIAQSQVPQARTVGFSHTYVLKQSLGSPTLQRIRDRPR